VLQGFWRNLMREHIQIIHEVDRKGNLFFLASAFIGALNKIGDALIRYGGGLANKIDANHKEILKQMSELSDSVAAIANDVTELQAAGQRVIDLLTQPNPDVAAAVAALQAADAGFDAIRDSLNAAGQPSA
jgi:methyl-accepting chemotaxis protein